MLMSPEIGIPPEEQESQGRRHNTDIFDHVNSKILHGWLVRKSPRDVETISLSLNVKINVDMGLTTTSYRHDIAKASNLC